MSFPVWVDVVRRADHAMYQVKRSGKDNVTLAEEAGYVP
jgi:PleD family two-component response regulator